MSNNKLDVRVYPIDEPRGNTLAFASVAIGDIAVIRSIRVIDSENAVFVSMPQSKDEAGKYHDVAYPLNGDLRKEINTEVLKEWAKQVQLAPDQRGYDRPEAESVRRPEEFNRNINVFPIAKPENNTRPRQTPL